MSSFQKVKTVVPLLLGLAIVFSPLLAAQDWDRGDHRDRDDHHDRDHNTNTPLALIGVIGIPGNPISSTDIVWADQTTERVFFSDRVNGTTDTCPLIPGAKNHGSVEVIDAENDLFIGRITSGTAAGTGTPICFAGLPTNHNFEGPNGVATGPNLTVWAGDGDSTVKIGDVNPTSKTYLQLVDSISLANRTAVSMCGAACNRADELGYDPEDHIVMVASDEPTGIPPYVSFVNADTHALIGQINFSAQGELTGGLEQPLWIPSLHRFFQTLPGTTSGFGKIAIVDPRGPSPHVTGVIDLAPFKCSGTGEALGDDDHVLVSCGSFPLVIDLHGAQIGPGITQVGGGDEVNFNPGDGRFIVASNIDGSSANPIVLGVIDSESGRWLQNVPLPDGLQPGSIRGGNPAALGENNHVFVVVHPPSAVPPADPTVCATFGWSGTGCVAVFAPTGEERDEHGDDR